MKTVRPMNNISKPKEENLSLIIDGHECSPFTKEQVEQSFTYNTNEELIDDNTGKNPNLFIYTKDESNIDIAKQTEDAYKDFCKDKSIENLMDEVIATDINENKLKVTILFTERQYNLWKNKGGEKWLKRALVGQKYSPHGRGKKKKK